MDRCPACGSMMLKRTLFTSVYYECPRCDDPEPLDPRGDSDILPDWNCWTPTEYSLKFLVKKYFQEDDQSARQPADYKVD